MYLHDLLLGVIAVASVRACCALGVLMRGRIVNCVCCIVCVRGSKQTLVLRFELQITSGERIGADGCANVHAFLGFKPY